MALVTLKFLLSKVKALSFEYKAFYGYIPFIVTRVLYFLWLLKP